MHDQITFEDFELNESNHPLWGSNPWLALLMISIAYIIIHFIEINLILTPEVYYNTLGEQMTYNRIDHMLSLQRKWEWVTYLITPIGVIIQAFFVTTCLSIGMILEDNPLNFKTLFKMVAQAMMVLALGRILTTALLFWSEIQYFDDIYSRNFFCLLAWVGKENVPKWSHFPLLVVNLFMIIFFFTLSQGLNHYSLRVPLRDNLRFVMRTYGTGLCILIIVVLFIQLGLSH